MGGCESMPGGLASSARERFIILFYYMRSYPLNRKPSLDYGAECPTAKLRHQPPPSDPQQQRNPWPWLQRGFPQYVECREIMNLNFKPTNRLDTFLALLLHILLIIHIPSIHLRLHLPIAAFISCEKSLGQIGNRIATATFGTVWLAAGDLVLDSRSVREDSLDTLFPYLSSAGPLKQTPLMYVPVPATEWNSEWN